MKEDIYFTDNEFENVKKIYSFLRKLASTSKSGKILPVSHEELVKLGMVAIDAKDPYMVHLLIIKMEKAGMLKEFFGYVVIEDEPKQ